MRIDKAIARSMLLISIVCLLSKITFGQKSIVLKSYSKRDMQIFNLNGAEVYMQIDDSNYYVPKIGPFECMTTKFIDSLIEHNKKRDVSILIRNARYDFIITMRTAMYLEHNSFEMYIYSQNKKKGYIIVLTDTHSWGTNSQILNIKPNKLWKPRYYK